MPTIMSFVHHFFIQQTSFLNPNASESAFGICNHSPQWLEGGDGGLKWHEHGDDDVPESWVQRRNGG